MFFNGNVFAELGRKLVEVLFADVPGHQRQVITSMVAHTIAGVLESSDVVNAVNSLARQEEIKVGDHVQSTRGTLKGVVASIQGSVVEVRSASSGALLRTTLDALVKDSQ